MTGHSAEYKRYLKSPEWAYRKALFFASHPRRCLACGTWRKIHLHHATYERLGREPDDDLRPLCLSCHRNVHAVAKSGRYKDLAEATEAMISSGQARRWRRQQYRRLWRWIMSRLGLSPRHQRYPA